MSGIGFFVDIFFAVAAIIIVVTCAKRGFIKNVLRLICFVLSVVIAVTLCPMVSSFIADNWLDEKISDLVFEQVISLSQRNGGETFDIASLFETEQQDFMELLERFGVDADKLEESFRNITEGTEETVRELSDSIATSIVNAISSVLAFIILFVAAMIVLSLIAMLLDLVARLPVLKQLNAILGFLCGVVIACAFVFVFSTVGVYLLEKLYAIFPETIPANIQEESFVLKYFSGIDSILSLVNGSLK
ncbi:MAG: CvpA family protein [Clostridia bacterium]|nr:CvpA family protein [Clostridia bacterium]